MLANGKMFGNFVCNFIKWGYCVFTTQYSGNDGSEGLDEFGGMDLADVLNLKNVIAEQEFTDMDKIAMCGGSRGGTMTYMSLASCDWIKCACIWSASTDLRYMYSYREDLFKFHKEMYNNESSVELDKRSAIKWVDKISKIPILLMHGSNDDAVKPEEALDIAKAFLKYKIPFKLEIFPGANHFLAPYNEEFTDNIRVWLEKYLVGEEKIILK